MVVVALVLWFGEGVTFFLSDTLFSPIAITMTATMTTTTMMMAMMMMAMTTTTMIMMTMMVMMALGAQQARVVGVVVTSLRQCYGSSDHHSLLFFQWQRGIRHLKCLLGLKLPLLLLPLSLYPSPTRLSPPLTSCCHRCHRRHRRRRRRRLRHLHNFRR